MQQHQPGTSTPRPIQTQPPQVQTQAQASKLDTNDIATMNDVIGSAGVDLRAEAETLQQRPYDAQQSYRTYEDRTRKQPPKPAFDTAHLSARMRTLASHQKITKLPDDTINYLALSLRARLQDLLTDMIAAAAHRTSTQFDRPASTYADGTPMWSIVVRSDVGKQLAALEKAERDEELRLRRERKERADLVAASLAAAPPAADEEDAPPKKKKKKEGPGVTARNMSEDVRKKMSNAVASQAAGIGGKYAWMNAAAAAAPAPAKPKREASVTAQGASTPASSSWARPYVPTKPAAQAQQPAVKPEEEDTRRTVTLRDALFVIEKERGHGGGKGSARGWT